jgi:DNA-binding transcriptional LysR family regulator
MGEKLLERRRIATVQPSAAGAVVDKRADQLVSQLGNAASTTSQPLAEVPE